jgi:hypothetical protein
VFFNGEPVQSIFYFRVALGLTRRYLTRGLLGTNALAYLVAASVTKKEFYAITYFFSSSIAKKYKN